MDSLDQTTADVLTDFQEIAGQTRAGLYPHPFKDGGIGRWTGLGLRGCRIRMGGCTFETLEIPVETQHSGAEAESDSDYKREMVVLQLAPLRKFNGWVWEQYLIEAWAYATVNNWDDWMFTGQLLIWTRNHASLFATVN